MLYQNNFGRDFFKLIKLKYMTTQTLNAMNIIKSDLVNFLKFVDSKTVLPILNNILITPDFLITDNLETTVKLKHNFVLTESILLDAKMLSIAIKPFKPKESINLSYLIQKYKGLQVDSELIEQFPTSREFIEGELNVIEFKEVKKALPLRSKDELRPTMTGIGFTKNGICISDVHRLYYDRTQKFTEEFILNGNLAKLLPDFFSFNLVKKEREVYNRETNKNELQLSNELINIYYDNYQISSRLIESRYPDFNAVIPQISTKVVELNKLTLINKVNEALLCANKISSKIELDFLNELIISSDIDYRLEYSDTLPILNKKNFEELTKDEILDNGKTIKVKTGELKEIPFQEFKIGLNGKFLLEILKAIDSDIIGLRMSEPNRAILINHNFLLMPVRIS